MADKIPMSEARQWEPEGPLRKTAGLVAKGLRSAYEWASEDPLGGSQNPPLKVAADFVGLPAIANVLDSLAYGDSQVAKDTARGREARRDLFEAAPVLGAVAKVPLKAAWEAAGPISKVVAPKAGETRMFVGPTEEQIKWAEKGERMGKTPEEIWKTGMMFRAPDKGWRTEISDAEAKFRPDFEIKKQRGKDIETAQILGDAQLLRAIQREQNWDINQAIEQFTMENKRPPSQEAVAAAKSGISNEDMHAVWAKASDRVMSPISMKMSDAYHHPELYARYPELKDVRLEMQSTKPKGYAHYSERNNEIATRGNALEINPEEPSVMAHEAQHHVQSRHGWDPGASSSGIRQAKENAMNNALRSLNAIDNTLQVQKYMKEKGVSMDEAIDLMVADGNHFGVNPREDTSVYNYISQYHKENPSVLSGWKDHFTNAWKEQRGMTRGLTQGVAGEMYLRNKGEAEARATQRRLKMSMEERRNRFPLLDYDRPAEKLIAEHDLYDPNLHFDYETIQKEMDAAKGN